MALSRSVHPTAYEVVVGDRDIRIDDWRVPRKGIAAFRARLQLKEMVRNARRSLERFLDPSASGIDASVTLVQLEIDDERAIVIMQIFSGHILGIRMRKENRRTVYSVGHMVKGAWRWGAEMHEERLSAEAILPGEMR